MTGSLHYRKNAEAIWRGKVPEKYTRILPHVTGNKVLEIGAAEGVMALLLAERGHEVVALEVCEERHRSARGLKEAWLAMDRKVEGCQMVLGDVRERPDLLQGIDTLVAVRAIYYLRRDAAAVLGRTSADKIVLCGNGNRARRVESNIPEGDSLGEWNRYSSVGGMVELIEGAGFKIETIIREGDPIVTGRRR